jgi:hypothetical protein
MAALVIPNAIAITTYRKEYIFRSFWDRDEAFNMLKDLVNRFKGIDTVSSPGEGPDSNMDMSTTAPSTRSQSDVGATGGGGDSPGLPPSQMGRRFSTSAIPGEGGGGGGEQLAMKRLSTPNPSAIASPLPTIKESESSPTPAAPLSKLKSADTDNELDTGPFICLCLPLDCCSQNLVGRNSIVRETL